MIMSKSGEYVHNIMFKMFTVHNISFADNSLETTINYC